MTKIEDAIQTAIDYEIRIRDIYREAAAAVDEEAGKRIFETLGKDEQHHIEYLQHQLEQLQDTGKIDPVKLESAIPSRETVNREADRVKSLVAKDFRGVKQQMLSKALKFDME